MSFCEKHGESPEMVCLRCDVVALEERVAHAELAREKAELARDNALTMCDEAKAKSKTLRASAGRRIAELLDHVFRLEQEAPEGVRAWSRERVRTILEKKT